MPAGDPHPCGTVKQNMLLGPVQKNRHLIDFFLQSRLRVFYRRYFHIYQTEKIPDRLVRTADKRTVFIHEAAYIFAPGNLFYNYFHILTGHAPFIDHPFFVQTILAVQGDITVEPEAFS